MPAASTSVITCEIPPLSKNTFLVRSFHGLEALSKPFRFDISTTVIDEPIDRDKILGKAVHLTVKGADFQVTRHGIVTEMEQSPSGEDQCFCNLVMEPKWVLGRYTVQSRIFQDMTVLEIAEEVFKGYDMDLTDWKKELQDAPVKREFTVQYNESDFDFISRLLEDEGIFYFFDHSGKKEVLVLADNPLAIKKVAATANLVFRPETGLGHQEKDHVLTFSRKDKLVTSKVTVRDYNYRTPETSIIGSDVSDGPGELYLYGTHSKYVLDASRLAKIRNQMLAWEKTTFIGSSNARALMPGYRFAMKDSTLQGLDGEYSVLSINHHGLSGNAGEVQGNADQSYTNDFTLIPATTPYRPALTTPKPRIQGILPATVDGEKGQYAFIDEAGRYKAKLFFDRSDKKDGGATKAIRMAQPYAGANYGMHFPLHTGTEIALGFADGDPDRPVGLGSLPNPAKGSPVSSRNKSQNVMKSHSGNQVCLEDQKDKTGVHIQSSGGHKLGLDDTGANKGIVGTTSGGYSLNLDDTKKNITIKTNGGHVLVLDDQNQKVSVTTTSGHVITLDDAGNKIHIADGGGKTSVDMDGGAGDIKISATNNITLHADGNMILEASGDFTLDAKNITQSALQKFAGSAKTGLTLNGTTELTAEALKVGVTAKTELKMEGLTVESTGKISNKVSAATVEVAGSLMTNITGAMVKLN